VIEVTRTEQTTTECVMFTHCSVRRNTTNSSQTNEL